MKSAGISRIVLEYFLIPGASISSSKILKALFLSKGFSSLDGWDKHGKLIVKLLKNAIRVILRYLRRSTKMLLKKYGLIESI